MRIDKNIYRDELSVKVEVIPTMASGPKTREKYEFYERFCGETPGEYICQIHDDDKAKCDCEEHNGCGCGGC